VINIEVLLKLGLEVRRRRRRRRSFIVEIKVGQGKEEA